MTVSKSYTFLTSYTFSQGCRVLLNAKQFIYFINNYILFLWVFLLSSYSQNNDGVHNEAAISYDQASNLIEEKAEASPLISDSQRLMGMRFCLVTIVEYYNDTSYRIMCSLNVEDKSFLNPMIES